jgi:hypothetical protein
MFPPLTAWILIDRRAPTGVQLGQRDAFGGVLDVKPLVSASAAVMECGQERRRGVASRCVVSSVLALCTLALVLLAGNIKLVTGENTLVWDAEGFFAPAFTLVADHARTGNILRWNLWSSAGSPDYAEPEFGATSPLAILVGALGGGTEVAFRAYVLLFWYLGGVGIFLLARSFDLRPWAALAIAVGVMFCGFYTGHAGHTSHIYSFAWIPWILWRFDVALRTGRLWAAVEAAALWGVSALGGYPELTILTAGFLFLWAAGRFVCAGRVPAEAAGNSASTLRRLALCLASLVLVALVGTAILAPSYVAFFSEGHGYSDRVGPRAREDAINSMPMPPGALDTFSSTYLDNINIYYTRLWPTTDGSFTNIYLGALIPVLALFAFLERPLSAWRWWLLGISMFAVLCAAGGQTPVRGWVYDYVPPTRYFRHPGEFRAYAMMCVVVLAIFGMQHVQAALNSGSKPTLRRLLAAALITTGAAGAAYAHVVLNVSNRGPLFQRATTFLAISWLGTIAIALIALGIPRARRVLPVMLVALALVDGLTSFSLASRATVSGNIRARTVWDNINAAHDGKLDQTSSGLNRELQFTRWIDPYHNNHNVPMRVATLTGYDVMTNRFKEDFPNHPVLLGMSTGSERIWFARDAALLPPTDTFYAAFVRRSEDLGAPVALVHRPQDMPNIREHNLQTSQDGEGVRDILRLPAAERVQVNLLRYTPNHLDFQVNSPGDGWLLVTDRWARGWRARVNGRPAEVFGGDFIFRALRVTAGQNTVQFSYRPAGYPWLLMLSWGILAGVCATSIRGSFILTQNRPPPA